VIKCLIKHYTRQSISEVKGPITVVSGKQRRLTFVECPQVRGSFSTIPLYPTAS
jgi:ribosome biogenesis protein BMS1